jgi:hypothetical protein
MKKDKQTVLDNIRGEDLSKLHFVDIDYWYKPKEDQDNVKHDVKRLKDQASLGDKVLKIMEMAQEYATYDENNKFQCRSEANRSAVDIWRIYNNYFRSITLFSIMRILYRLTVEDSDLETLFCQDINKQVFCCGDYIDYDSVFIINELGVRFAEWRTIGL